ncbi:uncharacterized protein LOC143209951 [Lasioglossum baleicum]|uniref:uncharacterized protein LOC143209951 n=1 Tax=Lasioglossum baleicum TaxID=434251 RepID=UPI003FCCD058
MERGVPARIRHVVREQIAGRKSHENGPQLRKESDGDGKAASRRVAPRRRRRRQQFWTTQTRRRRPDCTTLLESIRQSSLRTRTGREKRQKHIENSAKKVLIRKTRRTEIPESANRASLNMLEDITAKVWRVLPVVEIPRNWALAYCIKYTEISEQVEKASMQCQYGVADWDCTFIEMGGGRDDFNMGKIVSSFHEVSDQSLRSKLLRGAETCGKLWQKYKAVQEQRLTRMQLIHAKTRRKRYLKKSEHSRGSQSRKKAKKKKGRKKSEELRKTRLAVKKMKKIRQSLISKTTELEKKKHLNPEEQNQLDRLHLTVTTKTHDHIEEYPLNEERTELSRLHEIGLCLSRETAKACESVVLEAVQTLT